MKLRKIIVIWVGPWPLFARLKIKIEDGPKQTLNANIQTTFPLWWPLNWPFAYLLRNKPEAA